MIIRSGRLVEIKWSVWMSKSQMSLCVILQTWCYFVHIQFVRMAKHQFLAQFLGNNFTHLFSVLICCIHLCDWSFSLSAHYLHLLFCCILSILACIWLILIALFCAAIRRDFVSLLRFPFLSHVHVLSCEMLLISHLKRPYIWFYSHFCFLVIMVPLVLVLSVYFLVAVISLPSRFCMWSSSHCIYASTLSWILVSALQPSLLDTDDLSTSSLGCNALCTVIRFLILWSICLCSLLVHFKDAPEYLSPDIYFFDKVSAI